MQTNYPIVWKSEKFFSIMASYNIDALLRWLFNSIAQREHLVSHRTDIGIKCAQLICWRAPFDWRYSRDTARNIHTRICVSVGRIFVVQNNPCNNMSLQNIYRKKTNKKTRLQSRAVYKASRNNTMGRKMEKGKEMMRERQNNTNNVTL